MSAKKSAFMSAVAGVLVGSMLTFLCMPQLIQKTSMGKELSNQIQNQVESADVSADKVTYVQTSTDNIYKAVAKKAMPSVVGVQTTSEVSDYFGFTYPATGVGTGIIVDKNGYILTNYHVVEGAKNNQANILLPDGTKETGTVIWGESSLDLAVVKIARTGLQAMELGDSDKLEVGNLAIAIGNPLGLDYQRTMTEGIISGLNRTLTVNSTSAYTGRTEKVTMDHLIQTSAAINRGNSGGPLLDASGRVVGINTLKEGTGEALGFAIPINSAKPIIEQVITTGKVEKVVLGIKGQDMDVVEQLSGNNYGAEEGGAFVFSVIEHSPADKAGLKGEDVIIQIEDKKITGMQDISKALFSYKKGDRVKVTVIRDKTKKVIEVEF